MNPSQRAPEVVIAQTIVDDLLLSNADSWDATAQWPEPAIRALLRAGLGGLVVPESLGGRGQGLLALAQVSETLATGDASSALCFGMHCVGTACIVAKATDDQAERFLAPIAAGQHLTTLALSEPGTGSHFYLPQTSMRPAESAGHYWVTGQKCFVTNGGRADSYVLSTVAEGDQVPPGHFSLVLVEGDTPGLAWGPPWSGWGMRGNSSLSVDFEKLLVPVANRLGREGDQIWFVFSVVAPYFLVAMTGTYLGIAARAVAEVRTHLKRRHYSHTGDALSQVSVLQHKLGCLWAKLERTRQFCYWAASAADHGEADALCGLCAAKAEVAHAAVEITNDCMTLAGGSAYRDGAVLQRLLRDARAAHVMSPTTDLLYTWVGRSLLDLPLLGE